MGNKMGRPRTIETPVIMLELWNDYKAWCEDNKLKKPHYNAKFDSTGVVEHDRPYTWEGFQSYLFDIGLTGDIKNYRYNVRDSYNDFAEIITYIEAQIFDRNMGKSSIGEFDARIISSYLGMTEKREMKVTETPLNPDEMRARLTEMAEIIKRHQLER